MHETFEKRGRRRRHNYTDTPITLDELKNSINQKSYSRAYFILRNIDAKELDQETLKLSIKLKNHKFLEKVINKIDKSKVNFDEDVLKLSLSMKVPSVTRLIVDQISDKELFINYKTEIQKGILVKKDVLNMVGQILSFKDNESFDKEMQDVILDTYIEVLKKDIVKQELPKSFPAKEFESSLNESRYFMFNPKDINLDSLDDKNRFLMTPVFSMGHAFSVVSNKLDDNRYSLTFVNLGDRPFEKGDKQYKEFVYTKYEATKILKDYSIDIRLDYPQKVVNTRTAYKNFAKTALESYNLNVTSRDQKTGNCFTKNLEKGIRYALALGISQSNEAGFNPSDLRVSREGEGVYKVKFLKPIHRFGEKTNDFTTLQLKEELMKEIIKKFPSCKEEINIQFNEYKMYKEAKKELYPDKHSRTRSGKKYDIINKLNRPQRKNNNIDLSM